MATLYGRNLTTSAQRHYAITPDDDTDLNPVPRALYIGGGGDLVLRDETGKDVTYPVQAGMTLMFRPVRILSTGTTATDIIGWL